MEFVNKTKVMQDAYNRYLGSTERSIYDAYNRPSADKIRAWEYCKDLCGSTGHDLKIIGHNTFKFSAGYTFKLDGKNYFVYITDCSDRAMLID